MSRRAVRRRGSSQRPSAAIVEWTGGTPSTSNLTDYNLLVDTGADAADRAFMVVITQRLNPTVDPDGVTLGTKVMAKIASINGGSINMTAWLLPRGELPTGLSATVAVDNPTSNGARSMCRADVFKVTGQSNDSPYWLNPVVNPGAGTLLGLSPSTTKSDGATACASAAPGSNASYTWNGTTEAYDTNTESSDCRVSGGVAVGLPATLEATTSASVTNLMGIAAHWR